MNIVLTGSTGFIGKNLLKKLSNNKKFKVLNLVRTNSKKIEKENIKYLKCDLNKIEKHKKKICDFKPDTLIHLAWDKIPNFSLKKSKINENMSIKLIKFIEKNTQVNNIIISGSCFEIIPPSKSYQYFIDAKKKIFNYLSLRSKLNKFNYQWLRIFYVYGPDQRKGSLIPHLTDTIKFDKELKLNTPKNKHDFIYVDDVCDCIIKCLKKGIGSNIFEVGTGKTTTLKKILKIIEKVKNKKFILKKQNTKKNNNNLRANIKILKKKLNWKSKISIKEGIEKTIRLDDL